MIVHVEGGVTLVLDADDLSRLHVVAAGHPDVDAVLRSSGLGKLDDDGGALLEIDGLRARAEGLAKRPDWSNAWETMVAYASSRGWISADGLSLRAHVEC